MTAQYQRGDDHVYRYIAGEHLLVDLRSRSEVPYFALTPSAALLWERLANWATVEDLVLALQDEYEVSSDQASVDAEEFLEQLRSLGALRERDGEP